MPPEFDNKPALDAYDDPVADLDGVGRPETSGNVGCRDNVAIVGSVGFEALVDNVSVRVKPVFVDMVSVREKIESLSSSSSGSVALA